MKRFTVFALVLTALMMGSCGQTDSGADDKNESIQQSVAESAESAEETAETAETAEANLPEKPDLSADMSGVVSAVKEMETVFSGTEMKDGSTFEGFAHPDSLYCTEPQMIYKIDGTAEPMNWSAYVIDTENDTIAAQLGFQADGTVKGELIDPAAQEDAEDYPVPKLYHEGKGFVYAWGKENSPVYIVDGEVYYSLMSAPDLTGIDLPDNPPLSPVYKIDLS